MPGDSNGTGAREDEHAAAAEPPMSSKPVRLS
jgi:hypothetical protein